MKHFHYIVAGAGCAGLSLLVRLLQTGRFSGQEILLIDQAPKNTNDRTWCFWEKEPGFFESIVHRSWQQLWLRHPTYSALYNIAPYTYKMIRAIDFYQYCFDVIKKYPNVTIAQATIRNMGVQEGRAVLDTDRGSYTAHRLFSSVRLQRPTLQKGQYFLWQHFKGWVIETSQPAFNPAEATLMDFRTSQQHGATFVYVMPFSSRRALVEYTVFSKDLLEQDQYDAGLRTYISSVLDITGYQVLEEEQGAIPMTNHLFPTDNGPITWLGTAGGQTKASSGYTFRFIQKQTEQLVDALLHDKPPVLRHHFMDKRFHWYDGVLLNVLAKNKMPGDRIFTELFRKNKPTEVLQFLDNETSLFQEMRIITVLPKGVFIRAALEQL